MRRRMNGAKRFKGCVEMQVVTYMAVLGDKRIIMRIYEFI